MLFLLSLLTHCRFGLVVGGVDFPCEINILQIYDRNKYYIIEVPDIKGTQ